MKDSRSVGAPSSSSWERFVDMLDGFPLLREYTTEEDWDAVAFAKWAARSLSSGGRNAALFVLYVWDPATDWKEAAGLENYGKGRFELTMITNWDAQHLAAFAAWARAPFWM